MESEALEYYIDEVKHEINLEEEEEQEPELNEVEQAKDFLNAVGFSDLSKLFQQGEEISENVLNQSMRLRNLTEKQTETIRNRIRTLNRTLRSRQPKRKPRQDIRDIAWNVETSSTGTRSRSCTPDSLDSVGLNEDLTSDEDQHLSSLPPFPTENSSENNTKSRIKWTSSEPLQNKKFHRSERADVAHSGSENVILKGYQPLPEIPLLLKTPQPLKSRSNNVDPVRPPTNLHTQLSKSQNNITTVSCSNNCSKVYIHSDESNENETVSFEGLIKQNETEQLEIQNVSSNGISIDELSDSEYQYLKPIIYVELVTIFDQYHIKYFKRKASNKTKGGNVFGVNLSTLVMRDMPRPTDNSMVPQIVQCILNELNTRCISEDGILRVAGQKHKLELLCNEIESKFFTNRKTIDNIVKQATVHELTGVLKKLLRELPDPIFTMELFDLFYKTSCIPNNDDKIRALNFLVLMLPIEHRNTFRALISFFLNIIEHATENRMNLHNVAMITAPSFFPPRLLLPKGNTKCITKLSKEELAIQINGAAVCCLIMETMLKTADILWTVPNEIAMQAREAQKKAQDRKDMSKDNRIRLGKTKLVRSSTQYEPGAMNVPRIKRNLLV